MVGGNAPEAIACSDDVGTPDGRRLARRDWIAPRVGGAVRLGLGARDALGRNVGAVASEREPPAGRLIVAANVLSERDHAAPHSWFDGTLYLLSCRNLKVRPPDGTRLFADT